jgi:ferredoxin--NADP+ reductase, subunit alpha
MQKLYEGTIADESFLNPAPKSAIIIAWEDGAKFMYPIAKKLYKKGSEVDVILGFSDISQVEMECEFAAISDRLYVMTENGTHGANATICEAFQEMMIDKPDSEMVFFSCPKAINEQLLKIAKSENFS